MISKKIYLYLIKYICIQSKIFAFNEKYFCSILLFLCSIKSHTRALFQNQISYLEYFFIFYQCAINCLMVSNKKSCL